MSITCESALPAGTKLNGTQEGQYEILSVLGAGGFGITYKARDHLLQSDVAIKEYLPLDLALRDANGSTVKPRASNKTQDYDWGLERFLDEARTLSRFKAEPNIVRVENFLPANGTAYMVMQYEDGESLSEYLDRQGVLDEQQLKSILFPVLDGLRAIHAEGFLHRDIKPANIYLRKNGTPILLDFGAARQALGDHSRSVTGILTAGYAPFEQYSTRSNLTAATDLYALGATLYKCITGQTPVESTERINAMHNDEADPLVSTELITTGQYSDALYESLTWLLQPLSKDRPASVEEVIQKLMGSEGMVSSDPIMSQKNTISTITTASTFIDGTAATKKSFKSKWASRKVAGNYKLVLIPVIAIMFLAIVVAYVLNGSSEKPKKVALLIPKKVTLLIPADSSFEKAIEYYSGRKYSKALSIFRKLANNDHARSEYYISEIWRFGKGVPKNVLKSEKWLKRAIEHGLIRELKVRAEKGEAEYQSLLGLMYFRGVGVVKNYTQALAWIQKAATQGYATAQLNLGYIYEKGLGLDLDLKQAAHWYLKSALKGNALAQSNLGYLYSLGRGVEKNDKQAVYWYKKSASQGNANGQVNLGFMYNRGFGIKKDSKKAVIWYRKSAQLGSMIAQYNLAYMYANGFGVRKDFSQAFYWYQKSAAQGNSAGQRELGFMYETGQGTAVNYSTALRWYNKALAGGNKYAPRDIRRVKGKQSKRNSRGGNSTRNPERGNREFKALFE